MTDEDLKDRIVNRVAENNKEEFLDLFDKAVDRWLDRQFARVGKWALRGAFAALFVWIIKLYVQYSGALK